MVYIYNATLAWSDTDTCTDVLHKIVHTVSDLLLQCVWIYGLYTVLLFVHNLNCAKFKFKFFPLLA